MGVTKLRDRYAHYDYPVTIGRGGLAPVVALAGLFALYGARTGVPVALAAALGAVGGTASLIVHELGHVQAARRLEGIRSASVSLIWLGAATRFEGRYDSGREQAKVAIAGPRASFNMALALGAMCFLPMPMVYKQAVLLLALFNVAIGVLNLVPAYPLDGYKLVVGLLWSATGSEKRARRIIRRIGLGWAALELPATAVLLVERPNVGIAIAVAAVSFYVQKRLTRKPVG
jgi:Zn-dependent protease